MPAFLLTATIATAGRIGLGLAGLRNLGLKEGDQVDILYDESKNVLIVKPATPDPIVVERKSARKSSGTGKGGRR